MNQYLQTKPKNWFSRASIGYVTSDLAFNTGPNSDHDFGPVRFWNLGPEADRKQLKSYSMNHTVYIPGNIVNLSRFDCNIGFKNFLHE